MRTISRIRISVSRLSRNHPSVTPAQRRPMLAKRVLAARGLMEAVTFSFMPTALTELFGGVPAELKLVNPIASDLDAMRPSIVPNLLMAAKRNLDRGLADPALFEVGPQYKDASPTGRGAPRPEAAGGDNSSKAPSPIPSPSASSGSDSADRSRALWSSPRHGTRAGRSSWMESLRPSCGLTPT